jgi:hypothetical protein
MSLARRWEDHAGSYAPSVTPDHDTQRSAPDGVQLFPGRGSFEIARDCRGQQPEAHTGAWSNLGLTSCPASTGGATPVTSPLASDASRSTALLVAVGTAGTNDATRVLFKLGAEQLLTSEGWQR